MRPSIRLTLCSYLIILAGCSDSPSDGESYEPPTVDQEFSAALSDGSWHWAYFTAALGGDYDTWLTFDGEGNARWTREFWVFDHAENASTYPVETVAGTYELSPYNRVDVLLEETDDDLGALARAGAPSEFYFTGAVSETLPKLSYDDGEEVLTAVGKGLTTRAFAATGNGEWQSVFGHADASGHYAAAVTAMIDFDASECSLTLRLTLEREVDGTLYQADETTPAIPCRFETIDAGVFAIADSLRYHEGRGGLLENMGADERHGDALYYKLTEALQFLYFRPNATPNLLLPNGNNIVEDAWWTPRLLPAKGRG